MAPNDQHKHHGKQAPGGQRNAQAAAPNHRGGGNEPSAQADTLWVRGVIEKDNYTTLVKEAERVAGALDEKTMSQVRMLFASIKKLEYLRGAEQLRANAMLRPRMQYAASRAAKLRGVAEVLCEASRVAGEDSTEPEKRKRRFIDLAEAIVCYAKRADKSNGPSRSEG